MTAFQDVYPHVPASPSPRPDPGAHRASTVSGGHPLMPDTGVHARARKSLWPYLAVILLPLMGAVLIVFAVHLFGQSSTATTVPVPLVSVSPSACTFPDGS